MARSASIRLLLLLTLFSLDAAGCTRAEPAAGRPQKASPARAADVSLSPAVRTVIDAARSQIGVTTSYDPAYTRLAYPGGDVPSHTGVCTDVVIRAFRAHGVDLQKAVHEDMKRNFSAYPRRWGLAKPDTNIDHRRVPNLMAFFKRAGKAVAVTADEKQYRPGDVVTWDLSSGVPHIGLVSDVRNASTGRYEIIHNIGQGTRQEDVLFDWKVTGHYRYFD